MVNKDRLEKITEKSIVALKTPILNNHVIVTEDVLYRITRAIQSIEFFLDKIRENKKNFIRFESSITENLSKVATLCSDIDDIYQEEEISLEIKTKLEILKNKHKDLEVQFYNFRFDDLKRNYNKIIKTIHSQEETLIKAQEKTKEIEQKNEEILNRFSSMTTNLISLIITFTIVTTALSAIEHFTSFQFIPIFVIGLVFLGVSSVMVSSLILTNKKEMSKYTLLIWIILFIIFVATVIETWLLTA